MKKIALTPKMIRLLKKPWIWLTAIAVSASIVGLCFYWVSRTPLERKFNLWIGASFNLKPELSEKIEKICYDHGMDEVMITPYDPNDYNYAAAFGVQASSIDVFILHKDEAKAEAKANVFRALPNSYAGENALTYSYEKDGATVTEIIGVKFIGDYYIFIGSQSKKDGKLLFKVLDTVAEYGRSADDAVEGEI